MVLIPLSVEECTHICLFIWLGWDWVHLACRRPRTIVLAPDDEDECVAIDEKLGICSQMRHDLTRARNQDVAIGSQGLTASAMLRPLNNEYWPAHGLKSILIIQHWSFHTRNVSCTTDILQWCICRYIHIIMLQSFPARRGTVRLPAGFSERICGTLRAWTCRAGQQRKQYVQSERASAVFIHIQVDFHHASFKPASSLAITVLIFYSNSINWYRDKRKYWKNFPLSSIRSLYNRVQYSHSVFSLLRNLWTEKRLRLRFSLFCIFSSLSSPDKSDITHTSWVESYKMLTRRNGLECFDVWWYAKFGQNLAWNIHAEWYECSHKCHAGTSTCMKHSCRTIF
jgi:hypothetical protein